jgi:hypothetical protein
LSDHATDLSQAIAIAGLLLAGVGGAIALFNARKAVLWKRADLASAYMKELSSNSELVFACRVLDWNGGRLVVPEQLQPLLPTDEKTITHDRSALKRAMRVNLAIADADKDPRLQIYRTAIDSLLSWLEVVNNSLNRKLFLAEDMPALRYWVLRLATDSDLKEFIDAFEYRNILDNLINRFSNIEGKGRPSSVVGVQDAVEGSPGRIDLRELSDKRDR